MLQRHALCSLRTVRTVRTIPIRVAIVVCALALVAAPPPLRADDIAAGLGPDAQLVGGGGFAFGGSLDNYFLGRVRIGGLYASQPWIANLGLTAQVGGLARFGVGGELELNHGTGPYGSLGLARVSGDEWMTHAAVGYMIVGVEWQHRLTSARPSDALMFHVRLPLGMWWLQKRRQSEAAKVADAHRVPQVTPFVPEARAPLAPPSAAGQGQSAQASPGAGSQLPLLPPAEETERVQQLEAARVAHAAGDHAAEEQALARAEALRQEGQSALALVAAQTEQGKLRAAHAQLRRMLATYALSSEERARAEAELQAIAARLPHLRLVVSLAQGDERVLLDGAPEPSALAGYDVPIDPGAHELKLVRGERVLAERRFEAAEGELVRLTLELAL